MSTTPTSDKARMRAELQRENDAVAMHGARNLPVHVGYVVVLYGRDPENAETPVVSHVNGSRYEAAAALRQAADHLDPPSIP